jgi:WXG100 family type VII secretion target
MADSSFMIKPEEVAKSAGVIQDKAQLFTTETSKLYSEVENLSVSWKGETSDAFNADLNEYKNTLNEMITLLNKFIQGVTTSVKNYSDVDKALADKAKTSIRSKK